MSASNGIPDLTPDQIYGSYPPVPILVPGTANLSSVTINAEGRITNVASGNQPTATNARGVTNGTAVGPGASQAQATVTVTGCLTTSVAAWSLPNVPDVTWQTGIAVMLVVGTNAVTPYLINPTAATITPVTQTLNLGVVL